MIQKFKKLVTGASFAALLLVPFAVPAIVAAQGASIDQSLCAGANLDSGGNCDQGSIDEAQSSVNNILTTVINIFSIIVGVVAVIMIIIGGLRYITSGGDSGNVTSAKNTILYAIVGLVIVALSQIIVRFVLAKVSQS